MKVIDILGAFVAGIIGIAALSLVVAPDSNLAGVVKAFGESGSGLIYAAKSFPGK
jgi:hypothetical protein